METLVMDMACYGCQEIHKEACGDGTNGCMIPDTEVYGIPERLVQTCSDGSTVWQYDDGFYKYDGLRITYLGADEH